MRRLGLYVSVAFKAPVLVTMCMGVEDRSPIGMLVLVEKRYGGKSLLDMIIRWQKYIAATPKGDISYWLDENRLTELQIQRDYGDTSEIGNLLADTPIPSTNAQDNDDANHTPLLVPTHENTNTPDSPTHDTEQPQHSESEQQDELRLEQSLQDDSYKQVSIGPTSNSDFTAPDADYTDPNQYVEGKPPPKGLTWEQSDSEIS
eukprot:g23965.t1